MKFSLQGERDASARSMKDSSNSYDQHLLSKIGKPISPPQSISENKGPASTLTIPTTRNFGSLPSPGGSDTSMLDVKWHNSPMSAGAISPGTKAGWNYLDCRSPSVESSAPSSAVDHEHSAYLRETYRRRGGRTTPDNLSLPSRSNRGSYDYGAFSDMEGDLSNDDSLPPRLFQVREATPPYLDAFRSGTKRRASSPPREVIGDRNSLHVTTSNGDLSQRRTSGNPFSNTLSVNSGYAPSHGSHSAASSVSYRTSGSYSSAAFSLGGSSMTSTSPYERPSPGGLSPNSDLDSLHEKSILNPSSPGGLPGPAIVRARASSNALEPPRAASARKLSLQNTLSVPKPGPKVGGLFICDCCPKKPKKFDNPEELRAHEMEKQYSCQYCNNRFKNKNEAERHQNSLHLRRHSWSCAALQSYQAAFHPSVSLPSSSQPNGSSSHDVCGYCGEEFPNYPQPDWDRRFEHLTGVHKFGECNNAKKFFRADHFRQHLKHSHAGTSGKWTNILENACMKDEAPESKGDQGRANQSGTDSGSGKQSTNNPSGC